MTFEQKLVVLELAGYKLNRISGHWYIANGEKFLSSVRCESAKIAIESAWRHYTNEI